MKTKHFICYLTMLFYMVGVKGQTTISIELGADAPSYTINSEVDQSLNGQKIEFTESYYGGISLEIDPFITSNNWFVRLGALYSIDLQDPFSASFIDNNSDEINPKSLVVPFGLKYWMSFPTGKSGLFIEGGGIARYDLTNYKNGARITYFDGLSRRQIPLTKEDFNQISLGVKAAAGLWFGKFEFAANFLQNFDFTDEGRTSFNIDRFYIGGSLRYTIPLVQK